MLFDDVPAIPLHRAFDPGSLPTPPPWNPTTVLPDLRGVVAVDLETRDPTLLTLGSASAFPGRNDAYVVGVAVAADGFSGYYGLRHEAGGNTDLNVMGWLRSLLARDDVEMVCANTPYDLAWLLRDGCDPACDPWDVQGMAALLDENRTSYSLETLSQLYLSEGKLAIPGLDPKTVKDILWRLPANYVGPYAEQDATLTYRLFRLLHAEMRAQDLMQVAAVERPCLRIATEMRLRGVQYDLDGAERVREEMLGKEIALLKRIKDKTGVHVTATDNEALGRALRAEGFDVPMTSGKSPRTSITVEWLKGQQDELADWIIEARRWNKARTTFVESHMEFAGSSAGRGRIHGEFHPLRRVEDEGGDSYGTVSGRFSATNPNLQNIPARDPEVRKRVRTLFLANDGAEWGAADYSSQEPRLTVHFANLARRRKQPLPGAAEAVAAYAENPRLDYHQMTADLMGIPRKQAKAINLGLTYGMGGAKLCRELGLPTEWKERGDRRWEAAGPEGQRLLDLYNERLPFARILSDLCKDAANERGYIRTLLGRRCRWPAPGYGETQRPFTHKALNRLIQGSAADQTKAAMVMLWREHREVPLVTVHDEIGFSVADEAHLARVRRCMEEAVVLSVPTIVDITTGRSWGDAKE